MNEGEPKESRGYLSHAESFVGARPVARLASTACAKHKQRGGEFVVDNKAANPLQQRLQNLLGGVVVHKGHLIAVNLVFSRTEAIVRILGPAVAQGLLGPEGPPNLRSPQPEDEEGEEDDESREARLINKFEEGLKLFYDFRVSELQTEIANFKKEIATRLPTLTKKDISYLELFKTNFDVISKNCRSCHMNFRSR